MSPKAAKRQKRLAQGVSPGFDFAAEASRGAAAELEICRPFGAVIYVHPQTQRLRAGLTSHAASRLG